VDNSKTRDFLGRQAVYGNYLIFFLVDCHGVMVIRVLHGARRLEDLI